MTWLFLSWENIPRIPYQIAEPSAPPGVLVLHSQQQGNGNNGEVNNENVAYKAKWDHDICGTMGAYKKYNIQQGDLNSERKKNHIFPHMWTLAYNEYV